jgi:putative adhesin
MTTATGFTIEHPIGLEGQLSIRIRSGEVRLRAVDGDVVRVREVNGHQLDDLFEIAAVDGSLSMRTRRGLDVGWLGFGPRDLLAWMEPGARGGSLYAPELVVEAPHRASVVIEAASGEIVAEGLLGEQRYRTASGDVTLRTVSGRLGVEAVSGDVDIVAIGTAELSVRTVSGDIEVRAATLARVQAASTSGDLRLAGRFAGPGPFNIDTVSGDGLLAPAGDVQIQMTSVTGDLNSEFEGPTVTRGRRSLTIGRSGPVVAFRSMSGDLHVVRPVPTTGHDTQPASPPAPPAAPAAEPGTPAAIDANPPGNHAIVAAYDEARLRILRSLERGEIDVAEAGRRLEQLDHGEPAIRADDADPVGEDVDA